MSNNPPRYDPASDPEPDELEVRRGTYVRPTPPQAGARGTPPPRPTTPAWPDAEEPITDLPTRPVQPTARQAALTPREPPVEYVSVPRPEAPPTRRSGCLILAGMGLVTALACMLLFYGAIQSGFDRLSGFQFPGLSLPHATPTIITTQPAIILQVQALSRLETQQYVVEKVIRAEIPGLLPAPFTGDKILFIGHGEAVAGVDLRNVRPEDIVMNKETGHVEMRVPAAELFSVHLDEQQSYVYDRETGLLSHPDPNLETLVRQEAERQIRQAALEGGIVQQAQDNAEKTLRSLLGSLGYTDVTFTVAPPLVATPSPTRP